MQKCLSPVAVTSLQTEGHSVHLLLPNYRFVTTQCQQIAGDSVSQKALEIVDFSRGELQQIRV